MNKDSLWYKESGGDSGAIRAKGGGWVKFDCLFCAKKYYPEYFKTPRWQGPPSKAITRAMQSGRYKIACSKIHNLKVD